MLFAVGLLAFNAPVLRLFDTSASIFGVPVLFVYLFLSWACLILLLAISIDGARRAGGDEERESGEGSPTTPGA
ncbi:MAG: hypothetical protein R3F54_18335 [Alphaproteobacteria bacterium]